MKEDENGRELRCCLVGKEVNFWLWSWLNFWTRYSWLQVFSLTRRLRYLRLMKWIQSQWGRRRRFGGSGNRRRYRNDAALISIMNNESWVASSNCGFIIVGYDHMESYCGRHWLSLVIEQPTFIFYRITSLVPCGPCIAQKLSSVAPKATFSSPFKPTCIGGTLREVGKQSSRFRTVLLQRLSLAASLLDQRKLLNSEAYYVPSSFTLKDDVDFEHVNIGLDSFQIFLI